MGNLGSDGKPFSAADMERLEWALLLLHRPMLSTAPEALDSALLKSWHIQLSAGIERMRPGLLRDANITFGSFLGTAPAQLQAELSALRSVHLDKLPSLTSDQIVEHATRVHAELIRIHPFWDGNGRLARAVQTWLCWSFGQRAPQYTDRAAYLGGLNRYHHTRDLGLLMDATFKALAEQEK
ncbi:Fic family protein [Deinococcus radiopugnans]|uniref:Fic family protein n=1 Tax=Deinococcus radiopugnans ATCC 19172 TaxID=585398 RepID=A0A5C4Y9M7_9DEIO|nr:Fic family protein [Deinococcus radiopugnans]MBB6015648.1 fido (protein-threonine AMPylation protein) [Deinococcus radiopugnans ATCC 19172]TNM72655.1 Fic family protein [Deinococcus radiopugnans ATCC 19172]